MGSDLTITTDPAEVGVDAARLERLDRRLQRWVDDRQIPGFLVTVSRHGQLVHVGKSGSRDVENGLPVTDDTRWRIYSMTKPVTSVAAMMLYEEGAFELSDPISRWLPEFAETRVYVAGSAQKPVTQPQMEPIRVRHLLTHTSGLTYGFHHAHPVDTLYRARGFEWDTPAGLDVAVPGGADVHQASMPGHGHQVAGQLTVVHPAGQPPVQPGQPMGVEADLGRVGVHLECRHGSSVPRAARRRTATARHPHPRGRGPGHRGSRRPDGGGRSPLQGPAASVRAVGGKGVLAQTGTLLAAFFRFEPAVTLTVLAAGMSIDSPVCGLRPVRAERWVRSTVSRPETATFSPRVIASTSSSWSPVSTESTVEAGTSARLAMAETSSALFTGFLPCR